MPALPRAGTPQGRGPGQDSSPPRPSVITRITDFVVEKPWVIIIAVGFVIFGWWVKGTRHQEHEVRAIFDNAVSVTPGLDVRVDGLDAGKVTKVESVDGKAVVTLGLKDDTFWPLHQGTTATLRFGSTIGNGTRIVDLNPSKSGGNIPENGLITDKLTNETTEFDDFFDTFDAKTRKALQGTLKGTGDTFGPRAKQLGDGLEAAGPGLTHVGEFASDLAEDPAALRSFVADTYKVTATLGARHDQIENLVTVAARTFRTFAANTNGIQQSLDRFPGTLKETRTTLARLDTSLGHLDNLMTDLGPGAAQLAPLARALRPALATLRQTVPSAVAAFETGTRVAPAIKSLLVKAQPFATKAAPAFTDLAPIIGCVRPYAPEFAGLFGTWGSWSQTFDGTGHKGRIWANLNFPESVTSLPPQPSTNLTGLGLKYALVRPPGYNVGTPWFQPQCNQTADGLDASKDPEDQP